MMRKILLFVGLFLGLIRWQAVAQSAADIPAKLGIGLSLRYEGMDEGYLGNFGRWLPEGGDSALDGLH